MKSVKRPTPAAVLVPLVKREADWTIILTERSENMPTHPGQICFPGGCCVDSDGDAVATALRESQEELGIDPACVNVVGRLDDYVTGSGFRIMPVVGILTCRSQLRLDTSEVAAVFEVPAKLVIDESQYEQTTIRRDGLNLICFALQYERFRIWGATAAILRDLCNKMKSDAKFRQLFNEVS